MASVNAGKKMTSTLVNTFVTITILLFISFMAFVYIAIWFQSIMYCEMACVSFIFSLFFGYSATAMDKENGDKNV
jgi:hypothetical protein